MIELNSTIWSCKFTRKTGLTYAEAVESENNAANTLSVFPEYLEKPILFLVKQYSCRGRFEDLVNDCYYVMKDRFFISEEVTYSERSRKYPAKVVGVYVLPPIDHYPLVDQSQMKEPFLPAGDSYRYSVQILDGLPVTDDGLREGVSPDRLYRGKNVGARQKVKLFLKNSCVMPWPGTHYVVKPEKLSDGIVDGLYWNIVLSGMEPIFPRTPVLQRGRTPNCMKPGYVEPIKKTPKPKKEKPPSEKRQSTKRKLSEDVTDEVDDYDIDKMIVTPKRKTLSAEQLEKRKQKIEQQQKELEWFVSEAKRLNLDSSKIEQTEKLLTGKTIAMFKQKVKEAKDLEREKAKEEKKAKQREKSEYHKKRDDLQCDDLKPLPILPRLPLPTWLSEDDFSETLSVVQFFNAYQELLPLQEIRGTTEVQLSEVISAVRCGDPQNSPYADLMRVLLAARTDVADEEDGDEADLMSSREQGLINLQQCDPSHVQYGERIRDITNLHSSLRKIHGQSVRHLPIDWMTLTEVLRLVLATSGYYTGASTHRHRLYTRGTYRGYEDAGFLFESRFPETMKKLETMTVFDLDPCERLELMKVIMSQLLSYGKFRTYTEDKQNEMYELRKELKKLKTWDEGQEKEAKEARITIEYEQEQEKKNKTKKNKSETPNKKPTVSNEMLRLKAHLRALNERRILNRDDLDAILLDHVTYNELELDEIVKTRELQKEGFQEVYQALENKIYKLHTKIGGLHLGRDRAFRNYFAVDLLPALLIENPSREDRIGECIEATTFKDVNLTEEEKQNEIIACSGNLQTCPVHGKAKERRPRFSYVPDLKTFEQLQQAMTSRGVREVELNESFSFFKGCLEDMIDDTTKTVIGNGWDAILMLDQVDPYQFGNIDWEAEVKDLLLDLEEKIELGKLGSLSTRFEIDRLDWRRILQETGDVTVLVKEDPSFSCEPILTFDEIRNLNETRKLAFAFLQLILCVQLKFIQQPFVTKKDENGSSTTTHRASAQFIRWQTGLMQVNSLAALSLFLSTMEPSIQWDKSRLQGKCRQCRRKGSADELVLCDNCDKCYHMACVKLQHPVSADWICSDCLATKRKTAASEKRKAASEKDEFDDMERCSSDMNETKIEEDMDDDVDEKMVVRTSSGRAVKKVHYNTEPSIEVPLKTSKKKTNGQQTTMRKSSRNATRHYSDYGDEDDDEENGHENSQMDDENEDDFHNDTVGRNGKKGKISPSSSSTINLRTKFKDLEILVKDCMRQEFSWPFVEPVDPKEVPDYYDVIKRPMDLRTMMNKLKQRIYDKPEELRKDFNLIVSNCEEYNVSESEIYECAQLLADYVEGRLDIILNAN